MARFESLGRGGRGGRNSDYYYRKPKYLQNPPPLLKHKAPDLTSNPYYSLQNQYRDESAFIQQSPESNKTTNTPNQTNSNGDGWKTFFNHRKSLRKKPINKSNLNVTYNELQRLSTSPAITATPHFTNNFMSQSHNTESPSQNTLQSTSEPSSKICNANKKILR